MMIVELVSTGTELLLGQIVNTNATWLAEKLNALGFHVLYQTAIGDNRERMKEVFRIAMGRADLVITSGGLGPTQGDITKEVSAALFGRELRLHPPTVARMTRYFSQRGLAMAESNLRQAMIPDQAIVLDNDNGTAPGIILEDKGKVMIHLPGPPRELEKMFSKRVKPYLQHRYGSQGIILSRVLRIYGIGESSLEEKLQDLVKNQTNPTLALLAKTGEVHIRLTAQGASNQEACAVITTVEHDIRQRLGYHLFGVDDETLEKVAGDALRERSLTIALAESCTGGLITSRLTDIAGSSDYVLGSVICYSNAVKQEVVGVPGELLEVYGAVSEQVAVSMARNIRTKFSSHIGIGVTGIAGPGGATANKPVGLVYIAIDGSQGSQTFSFHFSGQRTGIKQRTSQAALFELQRYVINIPHR